MTLRLNNLGYNPTDLARKLGYQPLRYTEKGELNCVRPLGGDFPRFHIYAKLDPEILTINLHLDQNRMSHEGTSAHGGDYESDTVKQEAERVKEIIYNMN